MTSQGQRLTGKGAVVTGSSRGIGKALAMAFKKEPRSAVRRVRHPTLRLWSRPCYGELVNYRRMFDIEGEAGPEDVAVIVPEDQVEAQLRAFAAAGATDFLASVFPGGNDDRAASEARTLALLKRLNGVLGKAP